MNFFQNSPTDDGAPESEKRFMNRGQSLIADSQSAELVQSEDGAFHHPSGRAQMAAINSSTPGDPVSNVSTLQGLPMLVTVVPAIGPHTGVVNGPSAFAREWAMSCPTIYRLSIRFLFLHNFRS
ncbi:hypothetical protein ACFS07_34325 [Undibacterium arcticum]